MKSIPRWLLCAGFVLLILGGKLWLVHTAGSDLPFWDQWDAEGESVLRPWIEGRLTVEDVVSHHNEHRPITAELFALGLFAANGQWDGFVETTTSAMVHAGFALALLLLALRCLRGPWPAVFGALLVLLFTLPFSWENTLVGYQVQFYFLLLFSLGHIWLALVPGRFGAPWVCGQICGVLAVGTMASGFFSAVVVVAVLGLRFFHERRLTVQQVTTICLSLALCVAGWEIRTYVPGHEPLMAHGARELAMSFFRLLAWPGVSSFPWSLALMVPSLVFGFRRLRERAMSETDAVLLGLLGWTVLQCLAIAYGRGNGGGNGVLASRYLDVLSVNVALGFIFIGKEFTGFRRVAIAAVWCAGVAAGLAQQSLQNWRSGVVPNIARHERQEENVRAYLSTGDAAHLRNKASGDIPYPDGNDLLDRIRPPAIQEIMPPSVRRPVPIASGAPDAPRTLPPSMARLPVSAAVSTWSLPANAGAFKWRSAVQRGSCLPILRFRVAGDLGAPGRPLRLVVRSAAGTVPVQPDAAPGERWRNVTVFRPAGEWWVEADDADDRAWFAFTEPVELGRWTWFAGKLLKHWSGVLAAGALLLLAGAGMKGSQLRNSRLLIPLVGQTRCSLMD
jgi:hypothetical protein